MHRIRKEITQLVFENLLGDKRTLLPSSPAVAYEYTRPWASVVKHTSHPIASFGFNSIILRERFILDSKKYWFIMDFLTRIMQTSFPKKKFSFMNYWKSASFLMHRIRKESTHLVFGNLLGDMSTLLPSSPVVIPSPTGLPCAQLQSITSHPIDA